MSATIKYMTNKDELNTMLGDKPYIYCVLVDSEVAYVGKGSGGRYLHPLRGTSSCAEINRAFFSGRYIEVCIVHFGLDEDVAKFYEKALICDCIRKGATLYNRVVEEDHEYYTLGDEPLDVQIPPHTDVCVNYPGDDHARELQSNRLARYLCSLKGTDPQAYGEVVTALMSLTK